MRGGPWPSSWGRGRRARESGRARRRWRASPPTLAKGWPAVNGSGPPRRGPDPERNTRRPSEHLCVVPTRYGCTVSSALTRSGQSLPTVRREQARHPMLDPRPELQGGQSPPAPAHARPRLERALARAITTLFRPRGGRQPRRISLPRNPRVPWSQLGDPLPPCLLRCLQRRQGSPVRR